MRRPQWLNDNQLLTWIMNNEIEKEPNDWETDCWIPHQKRLIPGKLRPLYWHQGKNMLMYRVTWMLWHGRDFPAGLHACHTCGESRCINPLHILPGTPSENESHKTEVRHVRTRLVPTPAFETDLEKVNYWLEHHTERVGDCLEFLGGRGVDGYGRRNVMVNGKKVKVEVHRWVYCVKTEENYFDKSWVARHTCHNRGCINPEHILKGTRAENAIDSRSRSSASKITEAQAREIIKDYLGVGDWPFGSKRAFCEKWAARLGVSVDVPNNIVFRRRNWKDILKEYGL